MPHLLKITRSTSWLRPVAIVFSVVLLAAFGWDLWRDTQAKRLEADAAVHQAAAVAAEQASRSLEEFDRRLLALIYRYQSQSLREVDPQARSLPVLEALQKEPYFAFADVLDTSGRSVAGLPRNDSTWFDSNYFGALEHSRRGDMFIGDPFSRTDEQAVGITVSRRMTDGDDRFAGVVVMGVRLVHFRRLLAQFEGSGHSVMLLRRDGTIMVRMPFRLNDVGYRLEPGTPLDVALRTGAPSAIVFDPLDRVERQFAFQSVGSHPLVIAVGTPVAGVSSRPSLWWLLTVCGAPLATAPLASRRWRAWRRGRLAALEH